MTDSALNIPYAARRECLGRGGRKGMTLSQREAARSALRSVVVLALALVCAIPLWYIVINSFKTTTEMAVNPLGLPRQWVFDNYTTAFSEGTMVRSFANTIIVTVAGVAFQVLIGSLAAYGMILRRSFFTSFVGVLLMVAFVIPGQATLIPLYRMEASAGLVNTLEGLVVMYLGGAVFCYYLIVGYMRTLPFEIGRAHV